MLNIPPVGLYLCLLESSLRSFIVSNVFSRSSRVLSLEKYLLFSPETFGFLSYPGLLCLFPWSILEEIKFSISEFVVFLKVVQRYSESSNSAFCWNLCRDPLNSFFIP